MSVFNSVPPKISKIELIKWLKVNYSIFYNKKISVKELKSERDKNFLLKLKNKPSYIIKISNPAESISLLKLQDFVLKNLIKRNSVSNFIPKKIHSSIKVYQDQLNRDCCVRVLSFIEGKMYAVVNHNKNLEYSLGALLGNLSKELQNLNHPNAFRKFVWDPSNISWIQKEINLFKGNKKKIINTNLYEYNYFIKKNLKKLRFSLTHGDANNYNLVVKNDLVSGLLDYGDMIYAPTINDLAVSLAYVLMKKEDLYSSLKNVVISYHKIFTITFDEIFSLMTLVKARLTITVVMAEKQRKKFPDNKYLSISENDAWDLLYKLDRINPYLFIFLIRDYCGHQITKNYNKVINFIEKNNFPSVLDFNLNEINKSIINLDSNSIFTKNYNNNLKQITKKINTFLKKNDSRIGIGLYKEKRNVYQGNNFISNFNSKNKRDIHLGIDIFAPVGTKIKAPHDGKVFILKYNSFKYDYGPTIVLEHKIDKIIKFYTIYGHLSKKCLKNLKVGQKIKKNQLIADIGNYPINGNWPPHLHFQLSIDMMGEKENFPGVSEDILLSVWSKVSPDPNFILGIPNTFFIKSDNIKNLINKRLFLISNNLSISYRKPLQILEAKNQYFYDDKGREYVDCVNNISHVGHSHPKVHEALVSQNLKLNTNTRYIYKVMNDYSEKLLNKFPKKLDTIFFVCTGSEANDLAYRIAKTYTKAKDVLVMNNAYHGHTNSLIDISPYKFNGKGGLGKKEHVHILDMPDGIRGKWTYKDKNWIKKYIDQGKQTLDKICEKKRSLSCFFVESILGCGGQIILPPNYLKNIFNFVRKKNALCIIDEVQTGFGRVGRDYWAFEEHKVIPDIVTLGKPMGNGHPIAAVITTKEIAKVFNNGMEYFNSFGGNPVSCAVGNAVLDVIHEEKLQSHANKVGKYFLSKLLKIKNKFPNLISEVRGRGLFIGIDFIYNNKSFKPNPKLASNIINTLREKGILLSTDGPYHNVIKIKPPLPFNKNDVDFVCFEIDYYLSSL